jgi:hypothetical protein
VAKPKNVGYRADTKTWDRIRKAIVQTNKRVKVGILTDSAHKAAEGTDGEISLLELAAIHEFGSPAAGIPERSFMRATVNGKREQVNEAIEKLVGLEVRSLLATPGGPSDSQADAAAHRALGRLGTKLVAMIRATVRNRETVGPEDQANAPSTIAAKGSTLPLVDTGQLMQALTWAVVDKPGGDVVSAEPGDDADEG